MMKKIVIIMLVLISFFMAYTLIKKEPAVVSAHKPIQSKPNIVSQTEPEAFDQDAWQAEWDKKNKIEMDRIEQIWLSYLAGREISALDTEATYLQAYRDYKYYENCTMLIGNILYKADPIDAVIGWSLSRSDDGYDELPQIQKEKIEQRIEKCVSMTHFSDHTFNAQRVWNDLKVRMGGIPPESNEEKELSSVLKIIEQFEKVSYSIIRLKEGENIDQFLFSELWREKSQIERQYPQRLSLFGGYADADMPLVNQLNEQIKTINDQIEANKSYDKEALKVEQESLVQLIDQLDYQIFNVTSSDAYLAIHDLLNDSKFENELKPIKQILKQKLNLIPDKYSEFLNPIVTILRACELGHPCGPDSVLAEEICLDFNDNNSAKACDLGVLDYYLTHHLSPLQLGDVEFILDKGF